MIDPVWIVAAVFPIIGAVECVVEWAVTQRISINFWWISPIIGSLIYAANRKPIVRDSLVAGFIGWLIGTILGVATGYVSNAQMGTINIQPFNFDFAILNAMIAGIWAFWGSFIAVYFTLKGKESLKKR